MTDTKKKQGNKSPAPNPGEVWKNKQGESGRVYCTIIANSDDYRWDGDLIEEWEKSNDKATLRKEIESGVGMVLFSYRFRDFVRREADFLENFVLEHTHH
jgi:hypothetical protein